MLGNISRVDDRSGLRSRMRGLGTAVSKKKLVIEMSSKAVGTSGQFPYPHSSSGDYMYGKFLAANIIVVVANSRVECRSK